MHRLIVFLAFALSGTAYAQDSYPSRAVTIVVPFPPGGVADIVARASAPSMERLLKQPVVILNKPGAGGSVGAATVANAQADGYTLLMALASVSTNPEQERINKQPSSFQLSQLAPIARISIEPMLLAVRAESPFKSLKDMIDQAQKRPDAISYASSGVFGVYHVATEMFAHEVGIKLRHIPYKGGGPALLALLGGEVDIGLVTRSVGLKHLQSGALRPIAAWGDSRWEQFPDVPTVKELGYNVDYTLWSGLFAPAATPAPVMNALREAVRATMTDPPFRTAIDKLQATLAYLDAPDFQKYWTADAARLIGVVQRMGKLE